ncbi:MAG: hypothetical protein BGO51_22070 [Rhodospirillales bacterium 69-11]|nr:hypothetical protein [Rhodospirillales bacterium]OJW20531.1 MAG: hypothetical protein BGO51_22070 [Rhodospirillales bacterium 69-11]
MLAQKHAADIAETLSGLCIDPAKAADTISLYADVLYAARDMLDAAADGDDLHMRLCVDKLRQAVEAMEGVQ